MIILGAICLFYESFTNIITITYSALIVVQLLDINGCLHRHTWFSVSGTFLTIIVYIIFASFSHSLINMDSITWLFVIKILALIMVAWLPIFVI